MNVIGLISGTSVDGIDAVLVDISGSGFDLTVQLLAGETYPYPIALREKILAVCAGAPLPAADLAELDDAIAHVFAQAALTIQANHPSADLIGSHGQTVYHRPPGMKDEAGRGGDRERGRQGEGEVAFNPSHHPTTPHPLGYSLQLGRGAAIAQATGITTISNFRAADIALGGQGAPLVSAVDLALLTHPTRDRCIQNIGGIGNVTYLPARERTKDETGREGDRERQPSIHPTPPLPPHSSLLAGWDTGPGNVLLDLAVQHFSGGTKSYDKNGEWAATGAPHLPLVQQWLQQDFFQQSPPKSTGRELFSPDYLQQCLADAEQAGLTAADTLATLTELTAASIAHSYRHFLPQLPQEILLCGGGSKNRYLSQRIQAQFDSVLVTTTDEAGLSADFKEAIAFAVLAYWRWYKVPGNLPEVTGARAAALLGEIYQGNKFAA